MEYRYQGRKVITVKKSLDIPKG